MGHAASKDKGYSIRDAERDAILKGNINVVGRSPAQLYVHHQQHALAAQHQQLLFNQQHQAQHHRFHTDIGYRLGKIQGGVDHLLRMAGDPPTGSGSSSIAPKSHALGSGRRTVRSASSQHPHSTRHSRVNEEAGQVPAAQAPPNAAAHVGMNNGAAHNPAARRRHPPAPRTHGNRALGMHSDYANSVRQVRTRLGWR